MLTIYRRFKNEAGAWEVKAVKEGRGIRHSAITGSFSVRPYSNVQKRQIPHSLTATTFAEARIEADEYEKLWEAQAKGLTVAELSGQINTNRLPIKSVVETYLELKKNKAPKTRQQYRLTLYEFLESLGNIKFLDEINVNVLRHYMDFLVAKGFTGKTIRTRVNIVAFLLKKNGVVARIPKDELPPVEIEEAVPYTNDELKKMWAVMDDEQKIQYDFFLKSACRDREVTFAAWNDIDWEKHEYHVRSKPEVGFTVKSHESRRVPLPTSLLETLAECRKETKGSRWIFTDENGNPANHFLRKLKKIALRAGINCGHCETTIKKGKYKWRKDVKVSCATDAVCEHIYLHRFRKTCATRWQDAGIPLRKIQKWLGHKILETTQTYLGAGNTEEVLDLVNEAAGD
jgi:integrase/recombinase XerD